MIDGSWSSAAIPPRLRLRFLLRLLWWGNEGLGKRQSRCRLRFCLRLWWGNERPPMSLGPCGLWGSLLGNGGLLVGPSYELFF